jgi:hypothetical protein
MGSSSSVVTSYSNALHFTSPYLYIGLGMVSLSTDTLTKLCILKYNWETDNNF